MPDRSGRHALSPSAGLPSASQTHCSRGALMRQAMNARAGRPQNLAFLSFAQDSRQPCAIPHLSCTERFRQTATHGSFSEKVKVSESSAAAASAAPADDAASGAPSTAASTAVAEIALDGRAAASFARAAGGASTARFSQPHPREDSTSRAPKAQGLPCMRNRFHRGICMTDGHASRRRESRRCPSRRAEGRASCPRAARSRAAPRSARPAWWSRKECPSFPHRTCSSSRGTRAAR
jgi:hypothetical protein